MCLHKFGKWDYFFQALSNLAYSVSKPYSDSGALGMGDPGRVHILCRPAVKCEDDDEVHSGPLN